MYMVIMCYNCGRLLLAKADQRTRQCPHCEARLLVEKTKRVASAKSAREASRLLRVMKKESASSLEL